MKTPSFSYARVLHKSVACLLAFCIVNLPTWALNANDAAVSAGNATITAPIANTVSVDLITNRAVLDWTQMNANSSETLNFTGASGFAVLNRVASAVDFNGTLNGAGGNIYIISPSIILGPNASIKANTFTAAAMNISNQNFMDGIDKFEPFAGGVVGSVTNYATITGGPDGVTEQINLLGKTIVNEGVISLPAGGVAVMAAGEKIYLGEPGGKVIVEMTGIEGGQVVNNGMINVPNGKIILAAGDIYSIPLHPQYQAGQIPDGELDYSDPADKAIIDAQPIIAESGAGDVVQSGTIHADGANGNVVLTAGDSVTLEGGSETTSLWGQVTAFVNDFSDYDAALNYNPGAVVRIAAGKADFYGNDLLYAGNTTGQFGGTIRIGSQDLTIADVLPTSGPAMDTVYEEMVEYFSGQGIDLDLTADEQLTVESMADGQIWGRSGSITLRNIYSDGSIVFLENTFGQRTMMHTTAGFQLGGGDIFMVGGSGGIVAGDILTDTLSNDKISNPGRIRLLTTNGGDLETKSLITTRGNISEISAISNGNLIINGDVISENATVSKDSKDIGFARICLVAMEDITIDGEGGSIEVAGHGKFAAAADIIICAGENVTITNLNGGINATAQTSENTSTLQASGASVDISAGGNQDDSGIISINGVTYDPAGDNSGLPIYLEAKTSGSGGSLQTDPGQTAVTGDPGELTWEGRKTDNEPPSDYLMVVKLRINNNEQIAPGQEGSPCYDCPTPDSLPPVPHIFWIVDDTALMSWSAMDYLLDVLGNDDAGSALDGFVADYFTTSLGGTLTPVYEGSEIVGFEYTPPANAVFTWDGVLNPDGTPKNPAIFTDTFTYTAKDAEGRESRNTATVTIQVTNFLPTLASSSDTIHMSTESNPTSSGFDLGNLVVDPDGTPGTINYGVVEGLIPVANGSIETDSDMIPDTLTINGDVITYSPLDGYVSPDGSPTTFGYSVADSSIVSAPATPVEQTADLDVTVTNALPGGDVVLENAHMNADGQTVGVVSGSFIDPDGDTLLEENITPATDDYNIHYGGTLVDNGDDTFIYSADTRLPGYVGEDDFDAQLWDGQVTYYVDEIGVYNEKVYGTGNIDLNVTNERPSGDVWLGTTPMDTAINNGGIAGGAFTDADGEDFTIDIVGASSDDYNGWHGGSLNYDGTDYDYDPTAMGLPGYTGDSADNFNDSGYVISNNADDRFDVRLWDGEYQYTFDNVETQGFVIMNGGGEQDFQRTKVYGEGTVSVDIVNSLPQGDAWFGQVHMDSQNVTQDLASGFGSGITVESGTFTGSVIGSSLYGGTLEYDGTNWTYSTDTDLPGYVGDGQDTFGQPGYAADDLFKVNLSNGEYDYWFGEGAAPEGYEFYGPAEIYRKAITAEGTVSVDITNQLPTVTDSQAIAHMNTTIQGQLGASDTIDPVAILPGSPVTEFGINVTLTTNPDGTVSYTYTPADGYVGDDSFSFTASDGQRTYVFSSEGEIVSNEIVTVDGKVSLELTNIKPTAEGDLGDVTTPDPIPQDGITSPVKVTDPFDPQQTIPDTQSIVPGTYTGDHGGTLVFDGSAWTYTPAEGFTGQETFTINVWDGQNVYENGQKVAADYGTGTVRVSVTSETPEVPVAPLPTLRLPALKGCPAVMDAAAAELAINSDDLQLLLSNSLAANPNLQPCNACEQLVNASAILKDVDGQRMAALQQIFNTLAPADAPYTPEVSASVATAFADMANDDPQYALANDYVDAFATYVAVVERDIKAPVGDPVALVLQKYGKAISESSNPNIAAYITAQMTAGEGSL